MKCRSPNAFFCRYVTLCRVEVDALYGSPGAQLEGFVSRVDRVGLPEHWDNEYEGTHIPWLKNEVTARVTPSCSI